MTIGMAVAQKSTQNALTTAHAISKSLRQAIGRKTATGPTKSLAQDSSVLSLKYEFFFLNSSSVFI